ncbi:MAG: hypothetical protein IPL61_21525 [Myxococcales bacterium]|nr:hypothetical protein [Myxococcales bacterium]
MMVVRDAVAADQLVYAYPYAVGPVVDVSCGADEVVVLCPAWAVGGLLGPGRHQWQSPEPSKPLAVYFVLVGPVEVPFDMVTQFALPGTGTQVIVRASGSVLVRVSDPGMLVAQFVGLPFDRINDGLTHSVAQSVQRLLGKVLPRKIAMAGSPRAVTDPSMWGPLAEELSAYNPTVGSVFGVQFGRFASLEILQVGPDLQPLEVPMPAPMPTPSWSAPPEATPPNGGAPAPAARGNPAAEASGWIGGAPEASGMIGGTPEASGMIGGTPEASGMIGGTPEAAGMIGGAPEASGMISGKAAASGMIGGKAAASGMIGGKAEASGMIGGKAEASGAIGGTAEPAPAVEDTAKGPPPEEPSPDTVAATSAPAIEVPTEPATLPAGTRVLVALADGLLHSAVVRQALQGYYELEVGGAETPLWVPGVAVAAQP